MTDALSRGYGISNQISFLSLKKLIYMIERKRIAVYEQKIMSKYKKCVLVSQQDKDYLESAAKTTEVVSSVLNIENNSLKFREDHRY
jgi:hypothetical protein